MSILEDINHKSFINEKLITTTNGMGISLHNIVIFYLCCELFYLDHYMTISSRKVNMYV